MSLAGNLNRKRDVAFTLLTLLAAIVNTAAAFLNYVIWSDGLVAHDLYNALIETGSIASAAIAFFAIGLTALTYILGLDPDRKARPRLRTWLLATTFFLFVAGYVTGKAQVAPDNVLIWALVGISCALLGGVWLWLEKVVGKLSLQFADAALKNAPATVAYWWARLGLMLCPSHRRGQNFLALALARLGRCDGAEHFMLQAYEDGERDADLCNALGHFAECKGDLERAAGYYEEAYHLAPSATLFRKLISLWEQSGNKRKALDALLKLPSEERRHWSDHIRELMFEVGDVAEIRALCREFEHDGPPFKRAKEAYYRLLSRHPDDIATIEAVVELCRRTNEQEEQKHLLKRLVDLCPTNPEYRRQLIELCRWQGRADEVLLQLDALVDSGYATKEEKLEAANEHFSLADYECVEKIIRGAPDLRGSMEAACLLASSYFEAGRIDDAQTEIQRAKTLREDQSPEIRGKITSLETRIQNLLRERELEALAQEVARRPDDLDLKFRYFSLLVANGSADKVVVALEDLLQQHPELRERIEKEIHSMISQHGRNFRLMSYLSDLYLREKQWDKVYDIYVEMAADTIHGPKLIHEGAQKILKENPAHHRSLLFLAKQAAEAGRDQSALDYLERYYQAQGEPTPDILRLEFQLLMRTGQKERAVEVGQKLLQSAPADKDLLVALAQFAAEAGKYADALVYLNRALVLTPHDDELRKLANEYEEKKRRARIRELLNSLTNDKDKDGSAHMELGDLYHDFGQLNEAIVEYQKAARSQEFANLAYAKLGYVLATKGLYGEAQEMLDNVQLRDDQPAEESGKLKALLYRAAVLMENDSEFDKASAIYKRIFLVDAGYRDVVEKIEKLQHLKRK